MNTRAAFIELTDASVDFPVYNAASLSLKNRVLSAITGGKIDRQHDGAVVIKGLQNITLKIGPGERVGLVGPNGAGKTTLLRVLSGIYHPTQGQASITGDCVSLINIGLGIDPEATGRENILLRGVMMGMHPAAINAKTEEIIDFTGLGDFIDMPFRTYSSGMQMRLAFAVSTGVRPQILLLDEWLSVGDEEFKERAEQCMRELVSASEILILASHSRELLLANCTRLIWLDHGQVRMDGNPADVVKAYFGH
jgi:lipopolysaccharide transport system ATP-binding protein